MVMLGKRGTLTKDRPKMSQELVEREGCISHYRSLDRTSGLPASKTTPIEPGSSHDSPYPDE